MKRFSIPIPNLYTKVIFKIYSKKQYEKIAKQLLNEDILADAFCTGNQIYLNEKNKELGFIIHQSIHAVLNILKYKGIQDEQILAYTVQYIVEQFFKKFK